MGMLGNYDCHLYCDCCNCFSEFSQGYDNASQAREGARECGWKFKNDGTVICKKCHQDKNHVLPDDRREGSNWHYYE